VRKLVREQPLFVMAGLVLLTFVIFAVGAPVVAPHSPDDQNLANYLVGPSASHLAGTDQLGRDILSRTIYAGRVSLVVGFGVMVVGTVLAAAVGGMSGYLGGWADAVIQRLVDAFLSIPALILLLTVLSVVGTSTFKIIAVVGMWSMISSSRTIRSAVLTVKGRPYVEAARAVGAGHARLLLLHVAPNVTAPIIVIASLMFGYAILIEASLSFLGFGVPPPTPTWGGMLSGDSRTYLVSAPWMALTPGIALTLVVLAINLFGDGLRDLLDPRLRGSG
jgi:peptide/nickel transport system permease protein